MPTILFHLKIANEFTKKHKKYDNPSFFLGTIAPDAVNAYGFASKEKRWNAHIRDANLEKWEENVINFYNKNFGKVEDNYLLGYCFHILTDIVCDRKFINELKPDIMNLGISDENAFSFFCESVEAYENSELDTEWFESVKSKLKVAKPIGINGITEKMIVDWRAYNFDKYAARSKEEPKFIKENFAKDVQDEVEKILVEKI